MSIYLDNAATTKPYSEVIETVLTTMREDYANPSSVHSLGFSAASVVENARDVVADELNAKPNEIYFTSGGTESDNIALIGSVVANRKKGEHIIVSAIEHSAVLNSAKHLEKMGFKVSFIPPEPNGIISAQRIFDEISNETVLVSLMFINNELGTVQPIGEVGAFCRQRGILFHTDAVQGFGKYKLDVNALNIDLLCASAHKINGPKGVGALYVRDNTFISPVIFGGGQERGLRSGTVNAFGIAGFATALKITAETRDSENERVRILRDKLYNAMLNLGCVLNGDETNNSAYILNMFIENIATDELLYRLNENGLCVSAGSACSAGSIEPTNVITQIGRASGGASVRFSFGAFTTSEDIEKAILIINSVLLKIRG